MAKLYPPILEGVLPAFYSDSIIDTEGDVIKITVPFSMNRAVSSNQVGGIALKIKTVQSSSYLYTAQIYNPLFYSLQDSSSVTVSFHSIIPEENEIMKKLKVGQFYKIQIAYIKADEKIKKQYSDLYSQGIITLEEFNQKMSLIGEIGEYSTVGIAKYTTKPTIYINDFQRGFINMHKYKYTGFYNQIDGDYSERVYNYRFDVYDSSNNIIATSGDCLHDSSKDTDLFSSYDEFKLNRDLEFNKNYYIQYTVLTNNLLELSTPKYRIMQKATVDPEIKTDVIAKLNYDNGYVDISLQGHKNSENIEEVASGSFLLTRSDEDHNYTNWEEISRFKLAGQFPSRWLWRDFTVQQGKSYQYSLQQYNDKDLYSNKIYSNILLVDYEDAFLFDGEKQLRIRYNPKVTNFKAVVQETKTNTIGAKHPFIFRNGNAYSHEFPISGLISYQMDENNLFLNENESAAMREETHSKRIKFSSSTALNGENIQKERKFKLAVLEWLNNGEPKLFRSPSEGNYIVRLMNTSLTPIDTLGRMLHSFNSTAYEIADCTYENLAAYGFINLKDPEVPQLRWKTIEFTKRRDDGTYYYRTGEILNNNVINTVRFSDMTPGDIIHITFEDDTKEDIMIGATGSYYIDTGVPIRAVVLADNVRMIGSMTYSYYSIQMNLFDKIDYVIVTEVPTQQFIGEHDIIKEIEYVFDVDSGEWVKNPKLDILEFYYIYAAKRTVENVVKDNNSNKYWQDRNKTIEINKNNADPFSIYKAGQWIEGPGPSSEGNLGYNPNRSKWTFITKGYQDFYNNKYYNKLEEYQPLIQINDNIISVEDTITFDVLKFGKPEKLISGSGTNVEVAYQLRQIDFNIENDIAFPTLIRAKENYLASVELLNRYYDAIDTAGILEQKIRNTDLSKNNELNILDKNKDYYTELEYTTKKSDIEAKYSELKRRYQKEYDDYISDINTFKRGEPDAQWEVNQKAQIKEDYAKYIVELVRAQEEERKAEGLL